MILNEMEIEVYEIERPLLREGKDKRNAVKNHDWKLSYMKQSKKKTSVFKNQEKCV